MEMTLEKTRLSTKGQIVLPKIIRTAHAWGPGTEFTVEETPQGILLKPARKLPVTRLEDVAGCLKPYYKGKPITIKEMRMAGAKAVREAHAHGRY